MFATNQLHQITFSTQVISINGNSSFVQHQFHKNGLFKFYIFNENNFSEYEYSDESKSWQQTWKKSLVKSQVIYFPKIRNEEDEVAILKTSQGIDFFQLQNNNHNFSLKNINHKNLNVFNESASVIKAGHFYHDQTSIGLLISDQNATINFFVLKINNQPINTYSVESFSTDTNILGNCSQTEFLVADLQKKEQDDIILRDEKGLRVYKFNENNALQHLMDLPFAAKSTGAEDKVFFPNLTGHTYQDIVLLNQSGLFIFQYDDLQNSYNFLHYNPWFSKVKGWNKEYISSVIFQDINMDNIQEMLFTGPNGIDILSFDIYSNQWRSLLDVSELDVVNRYHKVRGVMFANQPTIKYPILFTSYKNELHWAYIETISLLEKQILPESNKTVNYDQQVRPPQIPHIMKSSLVNGKHILLLRDQLDCSSILNSVNHYTGKVSFQIPLLGSTMIKGTTFNIIYNSNDKNSNILGVGWSTPKNLIVLDHQSSIYPESEKYYWVMEDTPNSLVYDTKNSTDTIYSFKLLYDSTSNWQIQYFKVEEKWVIKSNNTELIYGCVDIAHSEMAPIVWEIGWKNWRGVGSSLKSQIRIATSWYLAEIRNENSVINFTYDIFEVSVPGGKNFTQEINLKSIKSQENEVIFNYSAKTSNKFIVRSVVDEDGLIRSQMVQTHHLRGYSVWSLDYVQHINFIYKMIKGERLLSEIVQEGDPSGNAILKFVYEKVITSQLLKRVILPKGTEIKFNYESPHKELNIENDTGFLRYKVKKNHKVHFIRNQILISYINEKSKLKLNIFTRSFNDTTSSVSLAIGEGLIKNYEIKQMQDFLAIICYTTNIELYLLRDGRHACGENFQSVFSKDTAIQFGNNFIIIAEKSRPIDIITFDLRSKKCKKTVFKSDMNLNSKPPLLFSVFHNAFVVYDGDVIWIAYIDANQEWKSNVIKRTFGAIESIRKTLDMFELEDEMNEKLIEYFMSKALLLNRNFIILSTWEIFQTQLYTSLKIFTLNSKYQLATETKFKVYHEDILDVEIHQDNQNGTSITIGYEKFDGKFKLIAKYFQGVPLKELRNACKSNYKLLEEKQKEMCDAITKSLKNYFILSPSKYITALDFSSATCGSTKFIFDGNEWKEGPLSNKKKTEKDNTTSVLLGNNLILIKENTHSSIQLYHGNTKQNLGIALVNLEINNFNDILNAYPIYQAYQGNSNNKTNIIQFSMNGDFKKVSSLPSNEQLTQWSNYETLVTAIHDAQNLDTITLVFRQMLGLQYLLPNIVVTSILTLFNDEIRMTGYQYSSPKILGATVYYEKVSVIPNNNKFSFGWYDELIDYNNSSKTHRVMYDADENLVKISKQSHSPKNADHLKDEHINYSNSTIFDKSSKLKVAEFYITNISDDEASFYGFEEYEVNNGNLDNSSGRLRKKWQFHQNDIVKNEFSLTGQNLLRLSKNILHASFKPKHQYQNFVASCWIRPQNLISNYSTPYLTADILLENDKKAIYTGLGEVKYKFNDWYYIEALIDFPLAKQVHNSQFGTKNKNSQEIQLTTHIVVSSGVNNTIDVDHIRFSPMNSYFKANIYNSITKLVISKIYANGLIKKYIYDHYQKEIASINIYGQLDSFHTYTKSSSVGKIIHFNSNIEIQPETGLYESFAPYSFKQRWRIYDDSNWKIFPGQLQHRSMSQHNLLLNTCKPNLNSFGLRIYIILESKQSFIKFGTSMFLKREGDTATCVIFGKQLPMALQAEVIIIKEHTRLVIWIDGGLYFDGSSKGFSINPIMVMGQIGLHDVFIFINPSIKIIYENSLGEKIQTIVLKSEDTVIVTEYLYDELGRQTIVTQPAYIRRFSSQHLLSYYPNFVTNKNPHDKNSVWKIGHLKGQCTEFIGEYDYSEVKYNKDPLNEKSALGLPGKEFSVFGQYVRKFASFCNNSFINNAYPIEKNYIHQVEYKPGGVSLIKVLNKDENVVAKYIEIPSDEDLLTTYEYDENKNVIKILPPLYHKKARTLMKYNSSPQLSLIRKESLLLQKALGTHIVYDKKSNIISKQTSDSQRVEHIYDDNDLMIFSKYYNAKNKIERIAYFDYDYLGRIQETGELINWLPNSNLKITKLLKNNTVIHQQYHYSNDESEPFLRQNIDRTITFNYENPLIEESVYNGEQEILSSRIIIPTQDGNSPYIESIDKKYLKRKLIKLEYPMHIQNQSLNVAYEYNKVGQMIGLEILGVVDKSIMFTYNAAGQVVSEQHLPQTNKNFTRVFNYNSAGYLTHLQDQFLTEEVYYTEHSYGGQGYSDGTITAINFQATWHKYSNGNKLGLDEHSFITEKISPQESALCFQALKKNGYLDHNNLQTKIFYPLISENFPIVCITWAKSRQIQSILGKKGFPNYYGYTFDYGNHQELIKAKYFLGIEVPQPLQPLTFSMEIPKISNVTSNEIWETLCNSGYIIQDSKKSNPYFKHGKAGKSFTRPSLVDNLNKIDPQYKKFEKPLQKVLASCFIKKCNFSTIKQDLHKHISNWITDQNETEIAKITHNVIQMLERNQYVKRPFSRDFINILKGYQSIIPGIVHILIEYFGGQLGEGEFDVESYYIDANGNHRQYYTGFDRYELSYLENTNQIDTITYKPFTTNLHEKFTVKHDSRGNIIQALHKGIQHIEYNLISNQVIKVVFVNRNSMMFHYNSRGERILKIVLNSKGEIMSKLHYTRDEFGRTLVERKMTYISQNLPPDLLLTAYIYGPSRLIGFIRHDQFYSIISDHEGSTRLVVRNGEVVAAYDYLPYGNLMRKYINGPEADVMYLFTGQELDEETGLYNFHARFYDPSIGRFYQVDPKEQYPSPYKYAGNSPISTIDPDGQIAFLAVAIPIACAVIGAYLKGSLANDNYNPFAWDYTKGETYWAIAEGLVAGLFVGVQFQNPMITGSILSAVFFSYLNAASQNKSWNPLSWNWTNPNTYIAAVVGGAMGYSLVKSYTFCAVTKSGGVVNMIPGHLLGGYIGGVWANQRSLNPLQWDWSSPETYNKIMYVGTLVGLWRDYVNLVDDNAKGLVEGLRMMYRAGKALINSKIVQRIQQGLPIHTKYLPAQNSQDDSKNRFSNISDFNNKNQQKNDTQPKYNKSFNEDVLPALISSIEHALRKFEISKTISDDLMKHMSGKLLHNVKKIGTLDNVIKNYMVEWINQKDRSLAELTHLLQNSSILLSNEEENIQKNQLSRLFNNQHQIINSMYENTNWTAKMSELVETTTRHFSMDWDANFSMEPRILTALIQENQIIEIKDLLYTTSYKLPNPSPNKEGISTTAFNCYDFVSIGLKHTITDIEWLFKIKNTDMATQYNKIFLSTSIISERNIGKWEHIRNLRSYFNLPLDIMTVNQLVRSINNITEVESSLNRQKRSTQVTSAVFPDNDQHKLKTSFRRVNFESQITGLDFYGRKTPTTINRSNTSKISRVFDQFLPSESTKMMNCKFYKSRVHLPPYKTNSNSSVIKIDANIDINSTLLLLDFFVRKITGAAPIQWTHEGLSALELQAIALTMITQFEEILQESATESGLLTVKVDFDPIEVQNVIIEKLRKGLFSEVSETLYLEVENTNPKLWENTSFLRRLKKNIKKLSIN